MAAVAPCANNVRILEQYQKISEYTTLSIEDIAERGRKHCAASCKCVCGFPDTSQLSSFSILLFPPSIPLFPPLPFKSVIVGNPFNTATPSAPCTARKEGSKVLQEMSQIKSRNLLVRPRPSAASEGGELCGVQVIIARYSLCLLAR